MTNYKEYLVPDNGGYRVAVQDANLPIAEDWIAIPEGAEVAVHHKYTDKVFFWKDKGETHWGESYQLKLAWYDCEANMFTKLNEFLDEWDDEATTVWQREQDEPFLTPECTLNDQYAEIEQVRQQTIEQTLAERQSTYGNFEDVAFVTENIMSVLAKVRPDGLQDLPNSHRMALYMIASKMARIVNGDFNHLDSWHDIGGYSKLIEKLIKGE